jgi:phosphatidylserine decarboxylase
MSIHYFNRVTQKIEQEKVLGANAVEWAYQNPIGLKLTESVFSKSWLSKLMGAYENSALSRRQIDSFVEQYQINMDWYESKAYSSFNDFFIRKFKSGLRPFDPSPSVFSAGAEARYLAFENIQSSGKFFVKGIEIDLTELLRNSVLAQEFSDGTLLIARLCPVDYHRFHFGVEGRLDYFQQIRGELHSVNPVALAAIPDVFLKNERHVTVYTHPLFGRVAMIEVGALGVGKIVQSVDLSSPHRLNHFVKGDEKGYFLFGGSTVIWLVQAGKLRLADDLLQNSRQGLETWIPLGDKLGVHSGSGK